MACLVAVFGDLTGKTVTTLPVKLFKDQQAWDAWLAKHGESWLQRFTPRGVKSIWSRINRAKALVLIESGRVRQAGLAAIEKAREDGRWEAAYDSHRTAVPPEDFQAALDHSPTVKAFFATLNSQNRYAILFRIQTAKKSDTRQRRIDQFIDMLERHRTLHG